ncbi:type IV toxin-antitoxin system AbiEi family antitoxin [Nocardia arizonensis]|uniref:type IV toxin-antitoxin system AbiEi family antitoxin n=1 Tax=Nocardia arizonensis TaxID=1141647 RepID=UPI0006D271C8|nr:type IV toxin-antitoxin system AbiEi family antitoxin [Nocardia arizonensis]
MAGDAAGRAYDTVDHGWRVLRRLAGRHAGFFTTRQVLRTGCETRVRAGLGEGTVTRAGVGLLRLAEWPAGPLDEYAMWAAWFDGAAAVSHQSAAELHGIGRLRPHFLHISVSKGRPPVTPRLVVLRRSLAGIDVESAGPFLVTTPVRTVLDLAESEIGQNALDEVVADAVAIDRCAGEEIRSAGSRSDARAAARIERALTAL